MLKKLRKALRKWLGIDDYLKDLHLVRDLFNVTRKNIERLSNEAIIGVDLGYKDESSVIIIQYSRATNGFKVIADTKCKFETYQRFVRQMRAMTKEFNASFITLDGPADGADLKARILPDKALLDQYERML